MVSNLPPENSLSSILGRVLLKVSPCFGSAEIATWQHSEMQMIGKLSSLHVDDFELLRQRLHNPRPPDTAKGGY
jgi:hypothetical protein